MSYLNACVLTSHSPQDQEILYPLDRLKESNFKVDLVFAPYGRYDKPVGQYGIPFTPTNRIEDITNPKEFAQKNDILIVPGGILNSELLRMNELVLTLVREFDKARKVLGFICHSPWVLASAGLLKGRKCTGFKGIKDDIVAYGGKYEDSPVVVDELLVTSPHYSNNAVFMKAVLDTYFKVYTPLHYQG